MDIDRIGHETWAQRAAGMAACMAGEAERMLSAATVMRAAIESGDEAAAGDTMRAEYRRMDRLRDQHVRAHIDGRAMWDDDRDAPR
jgi:hypothetical protein